MSFKVIPTPTFAKSLKALAKRHRSLKEDVKDFVAELERNPLQGVELPPVFEKLEWRSSLKEPASREGQE